METDDRFGLFQKFRPDGAGVECIFQQLSDAADYVARLALLYRVTQPSFRESDAYFIMRTPPACSDAELVEFGSSLIDGLRYIAKLGARYGFGEVESYLANVTQICIVDRSDLDNEHDDQIRIHESIGDFLGKYDQEDHLIMQLHEAYYSIACDYWLAWYLQWPYFKEWFRVDVFKPYFEMWTRGCQIAFRGILLTIARQHGDKPGSVD
jgi:hypothetical protein